jgi:hypothetical protein
VTDATSNPSRKSSRTLVTSKGLADSAVRAPISEMLGREINFGKIVHSGDCGCAREARQTQNVKWPHSELK